MSSTLPRGLRVHRVPGKPVQREDDGRYAIHLWLQQDGRFDGDLTLRMTPSEAELLHAQLCFALTDAPVTTYPANTPDCRKTGTGGTPAVHQP